MVQRAGLSGRPGLGLIGVIILGVLETLVFSAGFGAEATTALAVVAVPLAVLFAYLAVQNSGFWDRLAREPDVAKEVRRQLADRPLAPGEDDDIYARAERVVRDGGSVVAPSQDTAIALRALIWPDLLACLVVAVLLVVRPGTVLVVALVVLVALFPLLVTGFRAAQREHLDALYRATLERLSEPRYYYCYISRRKLDQLVDAAPEESENGGKPVTYGKPGLRQNAGAARDLVSRLRAAIRGLEGQPGGLPRLDDVLKRGDTPKHGSYHHHGRYKVLRYDDRFVYLRSGPLRLTCSVAYFSHTAKEDGGLDLHSGNVDFLTGRAQPEFDAVVFLTDVRKGQLTGTPLYLALPLESSLSL